MSIVEGSGGEGDSRLLDMVLWYLWKSGVQVKVKPQRSRDTGFQDSHWGDVTTWWPGGSGSDAKSRSAITGITQLLGSATYEKTNDNASGDMGGFSTFARRPIHIPNNVSSRATVSIDVNVAVHHPVGEKNRPRFVAALVPLTARRAVVTRAGGSAEEGQVSGTQPAIFNHGQCYSTRVRLRVPEHHLIFQLVWRQALSCENCRLSPKTANICFGESIPARGATVAERLDCSPPTKANLFGRATPGFSQVGILPDDAACRRLFSGISRFPPSLRPGAALFSPHFTLISSQDLVVESRLTTLPLYPAPQQNFGNVNFGVGNSALRKYQENSPKESPNFMLEHKCKQVSVLLAGRAQNSTTPFTSAALMTKAATSGPLIEIIQQLMASPGTGGKRHAKYVHNHCVESDVSVLPTNGLHHHSAPLRTNVSSPASHIEVVHRRHSHAFSAPQPRVNSATDARWHRHTFVQRCEARNTTVCSTMDVEGDLILVSLLIKRKKSKGKCRRLWVHPLLMERPNKGLFHNLFDDLQQDRDKFFSHFRMSKNSFYKLLSMIEESIRKQDTVMREAIPSDQRLALSLSYLGTGCSMSDLSIDYRIDYRIGLSTVSGILREVCTAIWVSYKGQCSSSITVQLLVEKAAGFEKRFNFPHGVAAVDGKHIRIIKPNDSGSLNWNFKHFFSILLLAACDSNNRLLYTDVGDPEKVSDSTTFKNTRLYTKLQSNKIKLPAPRPQDLFHNNDMTKYLINRRRIFHRAINTEPDFAETIIKPCCLLHNFVRERDGVKFEDTLTIREFAERMPVDNCNPGNNARCTCAILIDYFMNEAALERQIQKI
ncbi:hypothetical protein PR048_013648 [Dryococelus australis]|uniref:DDE Tnp4 domain-containing protein n=1 Tax=Dryococelus australis TaxID=614101 RepID=A0ABQ9HSS2_9NEOP|nr:hypothetical protein PR048_013648 [Dryococelus australis]